MVRFSLIALLLVATLRPASAAEPPYLKLAQVLGTPDLAYSYGPADKSQLLLKFVPRGQTEQRWTKMTIVSIVKVPPRDTNSAARGVIANLRAEFKARHANIATFDQSPVPPVSAFFECTIGPDHLKGIVYSPEAGFVTAVQVESRNGGKITGDDVRRLRGVIHH